MLQLLDLMAPSVVGGLGLRWQPVASWFRLSGLLDVKWSAYSRLVAHW